MGRLIAKKLSTEGDKKKPDFDRWALGPASSWTVDPMSELGSEALLMLPDRSSVSRIVAAYQDHQSTACAADMVEFVAFAACHESTLRQRTDETVRNLVNRINFGVRRRRKSFRRRATFNAPHIAALAPQMGRWRPNKGYGPWAAVAAGGLVSTGTTWTIRNPWAFKARSKPGNADAVRLCMSCSSSTPLPLRSSLESARLMTSRGEIFFQSSATTSALQTMMPREAR